MEQMDAVTLAVLADKCLKEEIWSPEIWAKFSWRAQQIASRTHEPELCYIFRAFSRADWFDQNLLTTYLGRLHRRLHAFQLPDVTVLLEGFVNQRFRQGGYLEKALTHLALLLQHRDDFQAEDLARCCDALRALRPLPPEQVRDASAVLDVLAEGLLLRELAELGPAKAIQAGQGWGGRRSQLPGKGGEMGTGGGYSWPHGTQGSRGGWVGTPRPCSAGHRARAARG